MFTWKNPTQERGDGARFQRAHPQTYVNLTYLDSTVITGNCYLGLDPFGRVIDQNWVKAGVSTDHFKYGYDRADNVLYKQNLINSSNSELYRANGAASGDSNTAYDPLGRLTNFARGMLTASANNGGQLDTVSAPSQTISYGMDALGNATTKVSNGSTLSRTYNAQNQEASNSASTSALYDHNGNEVKNEGRGTIYAYDAWNRLSSVVTSGGTALAGYNYDALGRRNEWYPSIAFAGGTLNIFSYYSAAGQVLEDRWATSTPLAPSAIFQNVWSEAYINAMVLRDQDYTNNTLYQRLYAQQDANWNTTAVTDVLGTVQERFAYDPYGNKGAEWDILLLDDRWGFWVVSVGLSAVGSGEQRPASIATGRPSIRSHQGVSKAEPGFLLDSIVRGSPFDHRGRISPLRQPHGREQNATSTPTRQRSRRDPSGVHTRPSLAL